MAYVTFTRPADTTTSGPGYAKVFGVDAERVPL